MFETGQPKNALFVFPEHRFYGQSLPAGPVMSYNPEFLYTLTVAQSLVDNVVILKVCRFGFVGCTNFLRSNRKFCQHVMQAWNVSANTKVIAFGGSYPGELAAFLRFQFPGVFHGALSSSAPLRV